MPTIKLPQTRKEIQAATQEILYAIGEGRWSEETDGREMGASRVEKIDCCTEDFVQKWLGGLSRMGAIERGHLASHAAMYLGANCEGVRRIGGGRVASVLARGRWRYCFGGYT